MATPAWLCSFKKAVKSATDLLGLERGATSDALDHAGRTRCALLEQRHKLLEVASFFGLKAAHHVATVHPARHRVVIRRRSTTRTSIDCLREPASIVNA